MTAAMHFMKAFWSLLATTCREWWNDNTFRLAASLSFYTLFSMAPVLLFAFVIASGIWGGEEPARRRIVEQFDALVGPDGAEAIGLVLRNAAETGNSPLAAVIAVVTLLFGSTVVFAELQAALNEIWDVEAHPDRHVLKGLLHDRARSFLIALGVGFLLLVSLVISAGLQETSDRLDRYMPGMPILWSFLHTTASFCVFTLLFAMIYKYLPDVEIHWRDVAIGAVVTASLFTFGKFFIGLYLTEVAIGSTYGTAGSLVVLLIWVYYSALISFFGAEFTQVYARRYGSHIHPKKYAVRIGHKSDDV